ncbi:MAG: glycosyltransferase family A protein [Longimicrobiales bacterium]
MSERLVSIIIPTRDRAEILEGAIRVALCQTYPAVEVIVVDDGSTDHTPDVLARLAADGVRSLRHPASVGAAAARNAGAQRAGGEYLLFEDDDCRGEPHRVETLAVALEQTPTAAYAYCRSRRTTAAGETITKGHEGPWSIGTPGALIRADAFREVGGFDASLPRLQDFDLWTRLLARWEAVEVPEVLYVAGWDDQGISASPARLLEAEAYLMGKYARATLPARHVSVMHRRLGGMLMVAGVWRRGLAHFRRAVRRCPACPRSWAALAAGLTGPAAYRALVGAPAPTREDP